MSYQTSVTDKHRENLNIVNLIMKLLIATVFCIIMSGHTYASASSVPAAGGQVHVNINYLDETVTVSPGPGGSTKFYISLDNKKTWEVIDPYIPIDISNILSTKEMTVCFKGNKDTYTVDMTLQASIESIKAKYELFNGSGRVTFITTTQLPIEYRNGANGQWKLLNGIFYTAPYELKGATVYFRTVADANRRSGKVVSVKIPKRPSAPSVKLDGGKLCISGVKNGETLYRIGDDTVWRIFQNPDTKVKTMDLRSYLALNLSANTPIPASIIEFRTKDNEKSVASSVKVIEIPAQAPAPANVQLTGTTLTVQDSNKKKYYEYTRISTGSAVDLLKAKWTSFTSSKPVIIKGASVTDKILVRVKSTTDSTTKQIILASAYTEFTVTSITTPSR